MEKKILVGTSKGLVIMGKQNGDWQIVDVHFLGMPVSMLFVDDRNGDWWIGLSHRHWGQKLHCSRDQGKNWEDVSSPSFKGADYRPGQKAKLKKIWCLQSDGREKGLWLGTEPGALFYAADGLNFKLVESLWNHPSRQDDNQWFGAGRDFPFIHSIVVHPEDPLHVYIAVSSAGVFESLDGGQSWNPKNKGLKATYLPNPHVEIGHDPHLLLMCKSRPEVLWQQSHSGIYRTENGGAQWQDVTSSTGLPDYGFGLAIDHQNPLNAWVIPAQSDEMRIAPDLKLQVFTTRDGGLSWQSQNQGLPDKNTFDIVLRHAFVKSEREMVFGTNNGNLYFSDDEGKQWQCLSQNLSPIFTIQFT